MWGRALKVDGRMDNGKKKEKRPHPRATASLLSALTFTWTLGLFREGNKRSLDVPDLYEPLKEHASGSLGQDINRVWEEEREKLKSQADSKEKRVSLLKVLWSLFGAKLVRYGLVLALLENVLNVCQPLLLGKLIEFFTQPGGGGGSGGRVSLEDAYTYAAGVVLCSALNTLIIHPYMVGIMHVGMQMRVACCSLIYRKALKLSKTALGQTTVGKVVNLLANDVNRFDVFTIFIHYLWVGPLATVTVLYFLWMLIGVASVFGVCILLAFIPLQVWLGKLTSKIRLKTAEQTDERVRLMNEIISGIRVIKMYTWEKPFAQLVSNARKKEINHIRKMSYIRGLLLSLAVFHSRLAIFVTVLSYVLFGNYINAEKVFVVTSYFNILRQTMTWFFPVGIAQLAEVLISFKRIQTFLDYDEIAVQSRKFLKEGSNGLAKGDDSLTPILKQTGSFSGRRELVERSDGITMVAAMARWNDIMEHNALVNINLTLRPGTLTAIIGPVGSGKTSLLHALLGELPLKSGSISISENISYASQEPWLFSSSVRQNILFGQEYKSERYDRVVNVCALRPDINQFSYGDNSEVGERGLALSGGQRARINLARAVYKEADVYLLDDPLSAVDTHVGKHLFRDCIKGFLKNKTVILVTHQLQYLNTADYIVVMRDGRVEGQGTYQQLRKIGTDFSKLLETREDLAVEETPAQSRRNSRRYSSIPSERGLILPLEEEEEEEEPPVFEEMRSEGAVDTQVYKSYFNAAGSCYMLFFFIFMCILTQLLASGGDYWIIEWVKFEEYSLQESLSEPLPTAQYLVQNLPDDPASLLPSDDRSSPDKQLQFTQSRDLCIVIMSVITTATVIVTLLRSYTFFHMCMRASRRLHDKMFDSITRAAMHFFNTNPSGSILNRFSRDMGSIDEQLPVALIDCIQIGLNLIGVILVVILMNHWLLLPTLFIGVLFYHLRSFYLSTSLSIKRLEGVTRSPVFSHLNASLQGITTIRAFNAENILQREFDNHQDLHSSARYMYISSSRAFGFWLDSICVLYLTVVTFSFLVMGQETFGGKVGLAITQAISLTGMFQWGMRQSAELENQMTSIERVLEFTDTESEPPLRSPPGKEPAASWPEEGDVTFSEVYMTYSPDGPTVLNNLSFSVAPKEKIGIVGRTGAGKSSLISALFRLANVTGKIIINGVDITTIGLHELRSKISIIPQEPVLFSGTVRQNLDPFDEYPDGAIYGALEEVELKDVVGKLDNGIYSKLTAGGSNLSVGQRQLLCLARAIVRNNRILVMDEATANVDAQTDGLIQNTIRTKFADCTVLTIAHRLNTVMDSDKVLVMSAGSAVEFDHPHILLEDKEGVFYSMVEQTGRVTRDLLHKIAADNYKNKSASE